MKLERYQILLDVEQRRALEDIAKKTGSSLSGVVRQIIDQYLKDQERERQLRREQWEKEKLFIDSLDEHGPAVGGRTWKREDLYHD